MTTALEHVSRPNWRALGLLGERVVRIACRKLCGFVVALAATCTLAAAQTPNPIPGYFDPMTGIFTPLPPQPPASPAPRAADPALLPFPPGAQPRQVIINVNATIQSPIAQDATLNAIGTLSINGTSPLPFGGTGQGGSGNEFTLNRSGSTASGSLTLNYSAPASMRLPLQIKVQLTLSVSIGSSGPRPYIVLTQIIAVQGNDATTTVTFPVTM
jgi:hypothetical protein